MIDTDYSFLRLRNNIEDAKNMNKVSANDFDYVGQVHLIPCEAYRQITNSPVAINLSTWEAHLIDVCGNELIEITDNINVEPFIDTNGVQQMVWTLVVNFDYYYMPTMVRFTEISSGDQYFTNPFIATELNSDETIRFDYKSTNNHYGTQYNRANYMQNIRLSGWFKNKVNESERSEYHQVTTDISISARNIKNVKNRYVLSDYDSWTIERLENLITNSYVYLDTVRMFSTSPIEFVEGEADSNISIHEMVLNPDFSDTYIDSNPFFDIALESRYPANGGYYTLNIIGSDLVMTFDTDITIETGTIQIHDVAGIFPSTLVVEYTEADMVASGNTLTISNVFGVGNDVDANGEYYILVSPELIKAYGCIFFEGFDSSTDWRFFILDGMYEGTQYDNTQYLTN